MTERKKTLMGVARGIKNKGSDGSQSLTKVRLHMSIYINTNK